MVLEFGAQGQVGQTVAVSEGASGLEIGRLSAEVVALAEGEDGDAEVLPELADQQTTSPVRLARIEFAKYKTLPAAAVATRESSAMRLADDAEPSLGAGRR